MYNFETPNIKVILIACAQIHAFIITIDIESRHNHLEYLINLDSFFLYLQNF